MVRYTVVIPNNSTSSSGRCNNINKASASSISVPSTTLLFSSFLKSVLFDLSSFHLVFRLWRGRGGRTNISIKNHLLLL